MDPSKGQAIHEQKIQPIAEDAYENNTGAYVGFLNNQLIGQVLFYLLIASILLFFSVQINIEVATIINCTFILLYLLGSIEAIMVLLPGILQAKVSGNRIINLRND